MKFQIHNLRSVKDTFAKKRILFGFRMHKEGFIPPILPLPKK